MFTTLTIKFKDGRQPYQLKRLSVVPSDQQESHLVTRVNADLHDCQTTTVFRAEHNARQDITLLGELALKVVYGPQESDLARALRHEFDVYDTNLKVLQGNVVPCCHGLFEGETASGFVSCLVLDYVGEVSFLLLEELSMEYRLEILESLMAIHDAGLEHGDFTDINVVFDEQQKPWIIDFENARPHDCDYDIYITEGARVPLFTDFGCREIWDFCTDVGIWRCQNVQFFGIPLNEDKITSVQYIMDVTEKFPHLFLSVPPHMLLKGAEDVWAALQAYKANGGIRPRSYEYFDGVSMEDSSREKDLQERRARWEKIIEERDGKYGDWNADDDDDWYVEGEGDHDKDKEGTAKATMGEE